MKTKVKSMLFTITLLAILIVSASLDQKQKSKIVVDLPEEHALISKDSLNETLMVAYQKNHTIYLGFKH